MEIAQGLIAFTGALAFVFAFRTNRNGWFFVYTLVFASCVAALVVI